MSLTVVSRHAWIMVSMALVWAAPPGAQAQTRVQTQQLQFAKGSTAASVTGALRGSNPDARDYLLSARAGQTMKVSLATTSGSTYFNVLAPGGGEALFAGESSGLRSWTGALPSDGQYTVRVFLNRAAARQGATSNFSLQVAVTGVPSGDAKVRSVPFYAKGKLTCSIGTAAPGSEECEYSLLRTSPGNAKIELNAPGGITRTLTFTDGLVSAGTDASAKATMVGDVWSVQVNEYEHYRIPEALISGG